MKAVLVLVRPDGKQRAFPLAPGVTIVGRADTCTLRVPLMDVSRKHCELNAVNGTLKLRDLGSSNGTFVNGKRVLEARLRAGDRVRIGEVTFVIQIDGKPADAAAAAPPKKPVAPAAQPAAEAGEMPIVLPDGPSSDVSLELSPDIDELSPEMDRLAEPAAAADDAVAEVAAPNVAEVSPDADVLDESELEVLDSGVQSDSFSAYLEELNEDGSDGDLKK